MPIKNDPGLTRLPPHSPEVEQAVLGCILLDPTKLHVCIEKLRDGGLTFYDLRHQTIYDTFIELTEDGIPIDTVNLVERLSTWDKLDTVGGVAYLSTLPDATPSAENIEYYLATLKDKYVMRRMIATCTEVVGRIYDHEGDADQIMDECERAVLQISESREEAPNLSMPFLVQSVLNDIEHAHNNSGQPTGLSTGFTDLDFMTGGFHGGQMITIAGRPSTGKSSLAMNIAEHVACDLHLPVGICSLEMTGKELISRTISSRARVDLRRMRDGHIYDHEYPKITNAAGNILHSPFHLDDTGGLSILAIRAKFRRWWQQHGIKVGIIDYIGLANAIGGKRKFESRQQEVSEISCGIKNLAKELNIPIIAISQMNREYEKDKNRKPRLSDLRESGSIEQDSDIVGFLYRPRTDEDEDEFADYYAVNLLIAKNRNGPTGDVPLTFFRTYTRFETAAKVSDEDIPPNQAYHEPPQQEMAYDHANGNTDHTDQSNQHDSTNP